MSDQSVWGAELYDTLVDGGVSIFAYVPDGGHKVMIQKSLEDDRVQSIPLTTEEEGVALTAGADLGGKKAVLLMQSSGTGNCINMLSLQANGRFPFLAIITMRGTFGEQNPWQVPMGKAVRPCLEAIGVHVLEVERPEELKETTHAAMNLAFRSNCAVALLLTQKFIGAKAF
ncbi:phosphonopyruvate decarboxylase [Thalassobaculum sp. OXR-137]|uniref:phosphonopyruvate decarboxylase n=1 Tax=Thalassobaculum sp. OXR-137 TaxID=3100173 RepID=UPI002AC92BCE|nr:phosphonopyruvate decarboxylase [Thalassobaculum sp. OXR-137]WPZ34724.1 phosphonopyruvate decarboxylase [Thalassobaculum sp. OXR-137]